MRFFLLRRKMLVGALCLMVAVAMLYAVNHPAIVGTAATTRQLPIYCVERDQKVCSISFDAAWGDAEMRQ